MKEMPIHQGPDRLELSAALFGPKPTTSEIEPSLPHGAKAIFRAGEDPMNPATLLVSVRAARAKDRSGTEYEIEGTAEYFNDAPLGHDGPSISKAHSVKIRYDVRQQIGTITFLYD